MLEKKVPLKLVGLGAVCETRCESQVIPFARFYNVIIFHRLLMLVRQNKDKLRTCHL